MVGAGRGSGHPCRAGQRDGHDGQEQPPPGTGGQQRAAADVADGAADA